MPSPTLQDFDLTGPAEGPCIYIFIKCTGGSDAQPGLWTIILGDQGPTTLIFTHTLCLRIYVPAPNILLIAPEATT